MAAIGSQRLPEEELQDYARLQVRSGLLDEAELLADVVAATRAEMPGIDAEVLARAWLAGARSALRREAAGWPTATDHDRLRAAFAECTEHGVPVLEGVADRAAATADRVRRTTTGEEVRGIVWFTPYDVWQAIDHGTLPVVLWHGSGAVAAPTDSLHTAVTGCLARHGLSSDDDAGRIVVNARWRRRPSPGH